MSHAAYCFTRLNVAVSTYCPVKDCFVTVPLSVMVVALALSPERAITFWLRADPPTLWLMLVMVTSPAFYSFAPFKRAPGDQIL